MNINFSLIKSNRGNDLLNVDNFLFECNRTYINSENTKIFYWRCSNSQTKCTARARTQIINQSHQILTISGITDHNHLGSASSIEVRKLSATIKEWEQHFRKDKYLEEKVLLEKHSEIKFKTISIERQDLNQLVSKLIEKIFNEIKEEKQTNQR